MATPATKEKQAASPASRRIAIARFGTFYLVLPIHGNTYKAPESYTSFAKTIVSALDEDPRVTNVSSPPMDESFSVAQMFYPAASHSELEQDDLLNGVHMHGIRLSDPIEMAVHVPAKNQKTFYRGDRVPSEDYFVLWDGQTLLISWDQDANTLLQAAGGQIIEDILRTAADSFDCEIYVQACEPDCENLFIHTDIRLDANSELVQPQVASDSDAYLIHVTVPGSDNLPDVSHEIWRAYAHTVELFGDAKSLARRALDLERVIYGGLDKLAVLHHQRAAAANQPLRPRLAAFWTFRHWRRESRALLATLWRAVGNIADARRAWSTAYLRFERQAAEDSLDVFFERDTREDFRDVRDIDLTIVESSMGYASARLDSSALTTATALIALATFGGGLAGAVVAALLSL